MNSRAVPTALSFGQLFLFQEPGSKPPAFHGLNKRRRRKKTASVPDLKRVALLGWVAGLLGAIAFQCLWPSTVQEQPAAVKHETPRTFLAVK